MLKRAAIPKTTTSLALVLGMLSLQAQVQTSDLSRQKVAMSETPAEKEARLKWWRDARFGMFIHWGPVSIKGTEITWSRDAVGIDVYDNLYRQFNPVKFDAKEWVSTAKAAGMKYIVFVAKHWDGFCMWPTKTTEYNIGNSPFQRDVCGELVRAAHQAGIKMGWYFCPADKHDPDCHTEHNDRYLERMRGQLTELLSNYGEISILWFDYAAPPEGKPWDQENTYALVRKLQPKIIIDNRLDMDTMADYWAQRVGPNADYYTPEQRIGGYDDRVPWETCMTIGTQWSYKPHDDVKSTSECIRMLIQCVGGDGNLLLNVGPTSLGEIEPPQPQRLKEAGKWLSKYGESIYGTRGGPFKPNGRIASTRKDNLIYVHLLRPLSGPITLPPLSAKIKSASLIGGGKVNVTQTAAGIALDLPAHEAKPLETVVKLRLDGSAMEIPAVPVPRPAAKLPEGAKVSASNIYAKDAGHWGPQKAFDSDYDTRWATDDGVRQTWIAIEYAKPRQVSSVEISEGWDRVRAFELECRDGSQWRPIFKGTTIGEAFQRRFEPVTSDAFRLDIIEATDGPTIWEIGLK